MSQIVLNGDVIDQNKVYPAIIIDGFDKTFSEDKMETNLMVVNTGSSEPSIPNYIQIYMTNTVTLEVGS